MERLVERPLRNEVWRKLVREVPGAKHISGHLITEDSVVVQSGPYSITLDAFGPTSSRRGHYATRAHAHAYPKDNFRFKLTRRLSDNFLDDLARVTGIPRFQPVLTNRQPFDRDFLLRSNRPEKARELFSQDKVQSLILGHLSFYLRLRTGNAPGTCKLDFHVEHFISDTRQLKQILVLFNEVLTFIATH